MDSSYNHLKDGEKLDVLINIYSHFAFTTEMEPTRQVGIQYKKFCGQKGLGSNQVDLSDTTAGLAPLVAQTIQEKWGDSSRTNIYFNVGCFYDERTKKRSSECGERKELQRLCQDVQKLLPEITLIPLMPIDVNFNYTRWDFRSAAPNKLQKPHASSQSNCVPGIL